MSIIGITYWIVFPIVAVAYGVWAFKFERETKRRAADSAAFVAYLDTLKVNS